MKGGGTAMNKSLLWISLVIAVIIFINECLWLGKSSLAWVIMALAIAIGLQAIYLLVVTKKPPDK
jgi:hypothetical protein